MSILSGLAIRERFERKDDSRIVVTPILDEKTQIGLASVDLRLGTKFLVDLKTREPFVSLGGSPRPVSTFFDETFRDFGEGFILYPGQLVLGCTFEYLRLPYDVAGQLFSRSSVNRLGISVNSLVQPGYAGLLTIELTNSTSNPIELVPGMRIVQLQFHLLDRVLHEGYMNLKSAKYIANAGPKVSNASSDEELRRLNRLASEWQFDPKAAAPQEGAQSSPSGEVDQAVL